MRHFGFWLGAGILNVLLQILRNYVKYVTNKNFHWKKTMPNTCSALGCTSRYKKGQKAEAESRENCLSFYK
jgi:hypothetical protein